MELDDLQTHWQSQDRRIDEILRITRRVELRAKLAGPRAWLRWFSFGALVEVLLGLLCASWTGSFILAHLGEPRFLAPAAALHLWFVGTVGIAVARYARVRLIDYGAPVIEIQRQVEALRVFTMRSLRIMFVSGSVVWGVPLAIVVLRASFGVDLYAVVGTAILATAVMGSAAFGFAVIWLCSLLARGFGSSNWLQQSARALSGYSLKTAQDQLLKLAAFEREI